MFEILGSIFRLNNYSLMKVNFGLKSYITLRIVPYIDCLCLYIQMG